MTKLLFDIKLGTMRVILPKNVVNKIITCRETKGTFI